MYRTIISTIFFLAFGAFGVIAQTPAPPQQQPVAITGGTIHTMTDGIIDEGTVLFEDGKITAVGNEIAIPEDAEIVDASGRHVYPGLIHSRTTLGLTEISRVQESTDLSEIGDINPNIRAQAAFHPVSEHLPVAAVNGVTTAVPTIRGSLIAGMTAAMMTDGWTWEKMTLKEGLGMIIDWPSMEEPDEYANKMDKLNEAMEKARRYEKARSAMAHSGEIHHPFDIRWDAMLPVLNGDMPVFISVSGAEQIQAAIAWIEKQQVETVLVGNRGFDLVAAQLADKNIPVMLSGVISGPDQQWSGYDEAYKVPLTLYEAGVDFCIAGGASAAGAYRLPHHAASAAAFGLPEEEAMKAITINAANILGIDDMVGSIEKGKDATLIITNDTPLELWTTIEQVYIRGRQIDMTDKHKRLFEQYMEKHTQQK